MSFRPEPPYQHGQSPQTAVLLVNLGTPEAPTPSALRTYLAEFLSDPRVVELPSLLWKPILHGIILRVRPAKSAAKYASIWMREGSPLRVWTEKQTKLLQGYLGEAGHRVMVRHAMRYGQPSIAQELDLLKQAGATRILIVPLYPQYSGATTASVLDEVYRWGLTVRNLPEIRAVNRFQDDEGYINALADRVLQHWQQNGKGRKLVMSFHGMPHRTLLKGDPYHCECHKTARLLAHRLGLQANEFVVTFQSRFGRAKWLEPYTEPTLKKLASEGVESVDVVCPGFVSDCIETLEEIAMECQAAFLGNGGKAFHYIPCLNDDPAWIRALKGVVERQLQGWPTRAEEYPSSDALEAQRSRANSLGWRG
ncbi:MAG TPA: ferrochelatase [Aquabacterium sp.]|nr:ferrochelatase [Aquabacterium sp.]